MAEEALELLAKDAVDDEVDGGVERDEEVGHRRQLRHLYVQNLKGGRIKEETEIEENRSSILMQRLDCLIRLRLSYPTETVLSNKITRDIIYALSIMI